MNNRIHHIAVLEPSTGYLHLTPDELLRFKSERQIRFMAVPEELKGLLGRDEKELFLTSEIVTFVALRCGNNFVAKYVSGPLHALDKCHGNLEAL